MRRSGRVKARFAPPLLATKLDRTTRNTAALTHPKSQQGSAAGVASEANGGAQDGASHAAAHSAASALDRFTRVAGRTDNWKTQPDPLVSYLSAGFFDGLLDPLPPAAKVLPPPMSNLDANGQSAAGASVPDCIMSFDQVDKAHAAGNAKRQKRKGVDEVDSGSFVPYVNGHASHLPGASEAGLRAENEELQRLIQRQKSVNDQMWSKLIEAGVVSAGEAAALSR